MSGWTGIRDALDVAAHAPLAYYVVAIMSGQVPGKP
jgi:hypothetical protein